MGKKSREKKERTAVQTVGEEEKSERKFEARTGLEKTCLFIIRWGAYLALFTPLIIDKSFFFPFVAPKTIFFRIIVEIILAAYLFLVIHKKNYRPRINLLTIAIVLFLGVFIIAALNGINLERSFWSTNERMTGIFTMLHLFVFFVILSSVFKQRQDWEKVLGVSILVGVILSLYDLMGPDLSSRGGATIGNTSFMAAYLLFDVFFAIAFLLVKRGAWQIFAGISLLAILPSLLTSTGRGAIVAFFLGIFLLALGYLIFSQKRNLQKLAWAVISVLIILIIVSAIFQPAFVKNKVEDTLSDMKSRLVVWEKGWKGFLEEPILGWGPENFNVVFLKYFNPCMSLPECGSEVWFDRTHNIVLDTLVTTGIIGLLSYLTVFVVAIISLLKIIPKLIDRRQIFLPLGMAVLLVVYFIQNLLVFDMINTYLVFFLTLAFIGFLIKKTEDEREIKIRRINPVLALIIIVATGGILWAGNIKPAIANNNLIKMISSKYVDDANIYFRNSLDSWMNKYESREQLVQKLTRFSYQDVPADFKEPLQELFESAETEMEKSIEKNSLDFRHYLFLGNLYNASFRISGDAIKVTKAESILQKAIQLSPTNQHGYWSLAETRMIQGRIGEAFSLLQEAIDLEPTLGDSHWFLAMAYRVTGQYQLAKEEIVLARKLGYGWRNNLSEIGKVIEVYLALGNDIDLVSVYQEAIALNPDDTELWAGLAASYANLGQFDKAREAAQKTVEINPDLAPQLEEFLNKLP